MNLIIQDSISISSPWLLHHIIAGNAEKNGEKQHLSILAISIAMKSFSLLPDLCCSVALIKTPLTLRVCAEQGKTR